MKSTLCIGLTPALQELREFKAFKLGEVNRSPAIHRSVAGKGPNVARVLRQIGGHPFLLGFVGGDTGWFIREKLRRESVVGDLTQTHQPTRICTTLMDHATGTITELVEEAVLAEFDHITERGGVLGAMETMYQRGKIQEESLYYEFLKHTGELPIMGVNTFLSSKGSPTIIPSHVIRATPEEQHYQINMLDQLHRTWQSESQQQILDLRRQALHGGNLFSSLIEATKYCSLGQITNALFEVGGQYRRNM